MSDQRLLERQLLGLDPRDNITVRYVQRVRAWGVFRGSVMVCWFSEHWDALGHARRLCDGEMPTKLMLV